MFKSFKTALRDDGVRAAFFAFMLSRAIVISLFIITTNISFTGPSFGGEIHEPIISLKHSSIAGSLGKTARAADANWYMEIAANGYDPGPFAVDRQHTWAFFPVYPLVLRAFAFITGDFPLTGMALSNLFLFGALVLLHKTSIQFGSDSNSADRAVFYAAVFPTSYFFSLPQTESIFLALTLACFYAARRNFWWTAGVIAALASATRVNGILLWPALGILYWQQHRSVGLRKNVLSVMLAPAGLVAFMVYLHYLTGNALAFKDSQIAWGRNTGLFLVPLAKYLSHPLQLANPWNFDALNFFAVVLALVCGVILLKRRQWALSLYTFLQVVLPLTSLSLQGLTRYVMVTFPVFMVLATEARRPWLDQIIRAVFLVLLGLMAALFAARFSIAMV